MSRATYQETLKFFPPRSSMCIGCMHTELRGGKNLQPRSILEIRCPSSVGIADYLTCMKLFRSIVKSLRALSVMVTTSTRPRPCSSTPPCLTDSPKPHAVARELSDSTPTASTPPHEILETDDAAILTADLPGCKRQDIDAQISEDGGNKTLTITAVRTKPLLTSGNPEPPPPSASAAPAAAGTAAASEPTEGEAPPASSPPSSKKERFELSFRVGEGIDVSDIRGSLEDGVLTLVLPKLAPEPPAEPIEIPIDFADGSSNDNENGNTGRKEPAAARTQGGKGASEETSTAAIADTHISLA